MADKQVVGILHPGNMGISIGASAQNSGNTVYWVSEGRSAATRARAETHNLRDAGTLTELCATCSVIISVCPPAAAEQVALDVADRAFGGLYVDANAISPERARRIGALVEKAGARFVDGGIIGFPAWEPGTTWLYLSGQSAVEAAACFSAGPLERNILSDRPGQASALKMCYAAFTKGSTALLCAVLAAAQALDVREPLCHQWGRGDPDLPERREQEVRSVTAKAWRFHGEMHEIASTFAAEGVPEGFHTAAAMVYSRLAGFRDASSLPPVEAVLEALLRAGVNGSEGGQERG